MWSSLRYHDPLHSWEMAAPRLFRAGSNAVATLLSETRRLREFKARHTSQHFLPYSRSSSQHLHSIRSFTTRLVHHFPSLLANSHSFGLDVLHLYYGYKHCNLGDSPLPINFRFICIRCTTAKHNRDFLIGSIKWCCHIFYICSSSFRFKQNYISSDTGP
jgi:hypothetical protein